MCLYYYCRSWYWRWGARWFWCFSFQHTLACYISCQLVCEYSYLFCISQSLIYFLGSKTDDLNCQLVRLFPLWFVYYYLLRTFWWCTWDCRSSWMLGFMRIKVGGVNRNWLAFLLGILVIRKIYTILWMLQYFPCFIFFADELWSHWGNYIRSGIRHLIWVLLWCPSLSLCTNWYSYLV